MKIFFRPVINLQEHPDVRNLPRKSEDQLQFLKEQILRDGINQPLIVDEDDNVHHGRHRLRVAQDLNLDEVPCLPAPKNRSAWETAILDLSLQRNYQPGAIAYMSYDLIRQAIGESAKSRAAKLKQGNSRRGNVAATGKTPMQNLADRLGISERSLRNASAAHRRFEENEKEIEAWKADKKNEFLVDYFPAEGESWNDIRNDWVQSFDDPESEFYTASYRDQFLAEKPPLNYREFCEPKIYTGELAIHRVEQAIAGFEATFGMPRLDKSKEAHPLDKVRFAEKSAAKWDEPFQFWSEMPDPHKKRVLKVVQEKINGWDQEVRDAVKELL